MSDLLCVPFRPGWQVGISERRKLCRPGGAVLRRKFFRTCLPAAGGDPAEVGLGLWEVSDDAAKILGVEHEEIAGRNRADRGAAGLVQQQRHFTEALPFFDDPTPRAVCSHGLQGATADDVEVA